MKIISLNANEGLVNLKGISNFFLDHKDAEIILIQENSGAVEKAILEIHPNMQMVSTHKPYKDNGEAPGYNIATYFEDKFKLETTEIIMINEENMSPCIYTKIDKINIYNFHGKSQPGDKKDTSTRIRQAEILADHYKKIKNGIILAGDFNLMPETESIKIHEKSGLKNLIKEFNITNTRNEISWRQYPNNKQYFADYTFVSNDILVKSFGVPYNEISDHLPMVIEFDLY